MTPSYDYDYIVIGSGFGGSVAALRLAEKGYRVLILEKGKWFTAQDFPKRNWNVKKWLWIPFLRFYGFFKISFFRHITILSGVGVGGGSLVYANTLPLPRKEFFTAEGWAHLADWESELAKHYQTASKMLGTVPNPSLETGDIALQKLAREIGKADQFKPTEVAVFFGEPDVTVPDPYFDGKGPERAGCNFCGGCMTGCRYNAKNTLDKNYLHLAQQLGTKIQAEAEVYDVRPLQSPDGKQGYRVKWKKSTGIFRKKGEITARGIIHFSYGHFFQIPNFELLYRNPQFKLETSGGTNRGIIGNSDLTPQQTISGEIGLQQQIGSDIVIDGTIFFRDIRDLAGTRADEIPLISGETYSRLVNSDFGFVKGFIISVRNRFSTGFNYTADYTFQIAKGTASDPNQARNAVAGGALPEVQVTPLGWDQRHTLNGTLGYNRPTWGISFIGRLGSGQPYTPRQGADVATIRENSQTKPTFWTVDSRVFKDFRLFQRRFSIFLRVFNLFDTLNEVNVYNDTGRAGFTTDLERNRASNPPQNVNTIDEWYVNITHYSEPRRIEFGFIFDF
ncbi:MAG: FAD-binding protein [bacterium]|nr:MAG: FAD-binding protein [bacterium]